MYYIIKFYSLLVCEDVSVAGDGHGDVTTGNDSAGEALIV